MFWMVFLLNSLPTTQGKIAMDGNFRHIAPRTALYAAPTGSNTLPSGCLVKTPSKTPPGIPQYPSAASPQPHSLHSNPYTPPISLSNTPHTPFSHPLAIKSSRLCQVLSASHKTARLQLYSPEWKNAPYPFV